LLKGNEEGMEDEEKVPSIMREEPSGESAQYKSMLVTP
jgi:hypothetical protein